MAAAGAPGLSLSRLRAGQVGNIIVVSRLSFSYKRILGKSDEFHGRRRCGRACALARDPFQKSITNSCQKFATCQIKMCRLAAAAAAVAVAAPAAVAVTLTTVALAALPACAPTPRQVGPSPTNSFRARAYCTIVISIFLGSFLGCRPLSVEQS